MTITTENLDPIEAAAKALCERQLPKGAWERKTPTAQDYRQEYIDLARASIAAYLRAAAEDGDLCWVVGEQTPLGSSAFEDMGRAAILALAEHVEAGR